jgi:acyl carrier protein
LLREDVRLVVVSVVDDLNFSRPDGRKIGTAEETPLLGRSSAVDSLTLVSLIVEIESALDEAGLGQVSLTSERAMSAARSPFRTIGSLIDFICEVLRDAGSGC